MSQHKTYLGDSVYADLRDSRTIELTTDNGLGPSNVIFLEKEVYEELVQFAKRHFDEEGPQD